MTGDTSSQHIDASAAVYSGWKLWLYDLWVLKISNSFAWRCPTASVLTPFFNRYLEHSSAHLDVGAGTGYYPAQPSTVPLLNKLKTLAFLDLNPTTLSAASARLTQQAAYKGPQPELCTHSVLRPLPDNLRGRFDSISLFYVFHCLAGTFPIKASHIAATLLPALVPGPDSTLYGATILGYSVPHNWFGRLLISFYTSKGIFGNAQDDEEGLRQGLTPYFDEVEIEVVGRVAIFVCRGPKSQTLR
jgi:hypothetical protein